MATPIYLEVSIAISQVEGSKTKYGTDIDFKARNLFEVVERMLGETHRRLDLYEKSAISD